MKQSRILLFLILALGLTPGDAFSLEIWRKYSKLSELKAQFVQNKELKDMGVTLTSEGSIHYKKPDFFEWKISKPGPMAFTYKNNTLELTENGKVVRSIDSRKIDPKMLSGMAHLKAWLTLDQKFIEAHYSIKELSQSTYEFTPIGKEKIFQNIRVEAGEKAPIKKMILTELSGDLITIEFKDTKLSYED